MRDLSDDLHDLRESSEEYAEEVQNTQYPMAARIDANKDGVSNQKDFQTNEKKVAGTDRCMPLRIRFSAQK